MDRKNYIAVIGSGTGCSVMMAQVLDKLENVAPEMNVIIQEPVSLPIRAFHVPELLTPHEPNNRATRRMKEKASRLSKKKFKR